MPASIFDPVSSALRLSLTADEKSPGSILDNRLISSAKSVLLSKVEFEESGNYQSNLLEGLKSKYIVLKPEKRPTEENGHKKDGPPSTSAGKSKAENGLPSPKKVLFPLSAVRLGLEQGWRVGAGMQNVGNTCYLNSTLQALFHAPAFANWLMAETQHNDKCTQNGGCVICGMRKTLIDTQSSSGAIKPWQVYSKLRLICRHLIPGSQEDAHEFLRYLVESMEKTYLSQLGPSAKQLDQYSKETTPLNQILGGYLRSAVRCLSCGHVSTTFQHFQDLLVDARKASTLDEALEAFFSRERLEDLGYKCESCNKKVSATKQFFIERAPMVLCIALKRFSLTGGKLSKHIQFRTRISLNKFMFHHNQASLAYRLVSVVTHLGPSQNCGHYTAVGLGPGGTFYQFDDSCVRAIPVSNVLGTNAYIMFYELEKPNFGNKFNGQTSPIKTSMYSKKESEANITKFIGPLVPDNNKNKENNPAKSKLSPLKINCSFGDNRPKNNVDNKPALAFRTSENGASNLLATNENGKASTSSANQNGNCSSKITNGHSSENGVSPSKKHELNGNASDNELKTVNGKSDFDKNNPQKGNSSFNDFRLKNKMNNGQTNGDSKMITVQNNNNSKGLIRNGNHNGESSSNQTQNTKPVNNNPLGLTAYDSESETENQDEDNMEKQESVKPQQNNNVVTKATMHGWKVSSDVPVAQHSPSLNGVVKNMPVHSEAYTEHDNRSQDTLGHLNRLSHRGYGAPVNTWNGTHTQLNRQVFDDKKNMLKRAAEADDEMDRGRHKKIKYNNYNNNNNSNKYYNNNPNRYNPFQETQNQRIHWGNKHGGGGNGGGFRNFSHYKGNFKQRPRGRFGSHYPRHHQHHQHYQRNH